MATEQQIKNANADGASRSDSESLSVTDNRTGKTYELPIFDGTCAGIDSSPDQGL